jgi:replicative DNA helicase
MLAPEQVADITEILAPRDFYRESHGRLFQLLVEMSERGQPTEMPAVVDAIVKARRDEEMGGIAYVSGLPDNVPSTENLAYYAGIIRSHAVTRRLVEDAQRLIDEALSGAHELPALMELAESTLGRLSGDTVTTGWAQLSGLVGTEFNRLQELKTQPGGVTGLSTGFTDLDRILAGLQRTDLFVLAARPSMGKTALALNIARAVAGDIDGHPLAGVGVFSLEMTSAQLTGRLLCSEARVDANKTRTGALSQAEDWPALAAAAERLNGLPIYIDDTPGLTPAQLRARARRLKAQDPTLALIVVDYIGLMGGDPKASSEQRVSAASRALKSLAKELNVAIIVLAQLSRQVENRNPKIPQLSDLRDSGAIEQDADVVMFIYRDSYYNKESTQKGEATLVIAKHRQGAVGEVQVGFQGRFTLFEDLPKVGQWQRAEQTTVFG